MNRLKYLEIEVKNCKNCQLWKNRKNTVFGAGNIHRKIMFIGEAPGYHEDLAGQPFVGKAGQFLDELLEIISLSRDDIYITNILKCKPPENRDPLPEEINACSKYLHRQIDIINPKIIVTMGNFATKFIFGKYKIDFSSITSHHGTIFTVRTLLANIKILPVYHPAAALHNPNLKEKVIADFKKLQSIYNKV